MKKQIGIAALAALGVVGIFGAISAQSEGESQVNVSCDTGATSSLVVGNMDFGSASVTTSQQTLSGTWGAAGAGTGIVVTDNRAACGVTGSADLWDVTLSFGNMSFGNFTLNSASSAASTFTYGASGGSGDIAFVIGTNTADIAHLSGSDAASDVVSVDTIAYASGETLDSTQFVLKRAMLTGDTRTGIWGTTPDVTITLPGNTPPNVYTGTITATLNTVY